MESVKKKSILWILVKLKLEEFIRGNRTKKNKRGVSNGIGSAALIILYAIGWLLVAASLGMAFYIIAVTASARGLEWVYFAYMAMGMFFLCFIGSVFMTESQMFQAKDNERLLAMPIRHWDILTSRMVSLLVWNSIFGSVVGIPGGIIYLVVKGFNPVVLILILLALIIVPLLALTVSMLAGWLISILTSKMKNTMIVKLAISVAGTLIYFKFIMGDGGWVQSLMTHMAQNAKFIKTYIPPAYSVGMALAKQDIIHIFLMVAWHVIPFILVSLLVSRNFLRLITSGDGKGSFKYKSKDLKSSSPIISLAKVEWNRFISSVAYIMNGGMGLLMLLILSVFTLTNKELPQELLYILDISSDEGGRLMALMMTIAILGVISLVTISATSISLEANTLWQIKSLPLSGREYLLAKSIPHIIVSLPFVILAGILVQLNLDASILDRVLIVLIPVAASIFNSLLGVRINARFPKFDWNNETQAIKQGVSIILAMLLSAVPSLLFVIGLVFIISTQRMLLLNVYMPGMLVCYILLSLWMYLWIIRKGEKTLSELES